MQYNYFIKTLKQHQTSHIKALSLPKSCTPQKIPDTFLSFLPDIVNLLEVHIQQLCEANQCLAVFGFQPGSVPVTSNIPLTLNRVINENLPAQHLCCALTYLTISNNQTTKIKTWDGSKTIMVDFTTGLVMDGEYYASLLFDEPPVGILYGVLENAKLDAIWASLPYAKVTPARPVRDGSCQRAA